MLNLELINDLEELNPWIRGDKEHDLVQDGEYIPRLQEEMLLEPEWDRSMSQPTLSRGFRSFLDAYQPETAILITKDYLGEVMVNSCRVLFIPISKLDPFFGLLK